MTGGRFLQDESPSIFSFENEHCEYAPLVRSSVSVLFFSVFFFLHISLVLCGDVIDVKVRAGLRSHAKDAILAFDSFWQKKKSGRDSCLCVPLLRNGRRSNIIDMERRREIGGGGGGGGGPLSPSRSVKRGSAEMSSSSSSLGRREVHYYIS